MLYIGYPVTYETACELFRMSPDTPRIEDTIRSCGLDLYRTDKGQYILGLEVKEVACLWGNFVRVEDGVDAICMRTKQVVSCFQDAGVDLSDFLLECMESEPIRVHNPPPYLITA